MYDNLSAQVRASPPLFNLPPAEEAVEIRRAAGISRTVAAAAIGVSQATLARWETGTTAPQLTHSFRYRQFLRVCRDAVVGSVMPGRTTAGAIG